MYAIRSYYEFFDLDGGAQPVHHRHRFPVSIRRFGALAPGNQGDALAAQGAPPHLGQVDRLRPLRGFLKYGDGRIELFSFQRQVAAFQQGLDEVRITSYNVCYTKLLRGSGGCPRVSRSFSTQGRYPPP